jgi:outer membrane immunogenic protein
MRTLVFALSALAFGTVAASAADLPVKAPPPVVVVPDFSWTGLWVGADFGGEWNSQKAFWPNSVGIVNFNHSSSQGVGGLHFGGQYQWSNNFVLGGEVAWFSSFNDTMVAGTPLSGCPNAAFTCQAGVESVVTIGPRLGYAWRDVLFYGMGGWASGEIDTRVFSNNVQQDNFSRRHDGWFAGAGIDWAAWKGRQTAIIIGLEYKHVDLGTATMISPVDGFSTCIGVNCRTIRTSMDVVQAKFSIKFDPITPLAPVVARY